MKTSCCQTCLPKRHASRGVRSLSELEEIMRAVVCSSVSQLSCRRWKYPGRFSTGTPCAVRACAPSLSPPSLLRAAWADLSKSVCVFRPAGQSRVVQRRPAERIDQGHGALVPPGPGGPGLEQQLGRPEVGPLGRLHQRGRTRHCPGHAVREAWPVRGRAGCPDRRVELWTVAVLLWGQRSSRVSGGAVVQSSSSSSSPIVIVATQLQKLRCP